MRMVIVFVIGANSLPALYRLATTSITPIGTRFSPWLVRCSRRLLWLAQATTVISQLLVATLELVLQMALIKCGAIVGW